MSQYPPPSSGYIFGFNSQYFNWQDKSLTISYADARYLKLTGGSITGSLLADGYINASEYRLSNNVIDFSSITSITNGTISANKAVIVDTNKDITGFRNIGLTGNLTLSSSSPSISLSNPLTINNSTIWTSGVAPSTTNGIGIRFIGASSTGIIRSYNYVMSSMNNISINDSAIYIRDNSNIGIGNSSPAYKLHVMGTVKAENGSLLVGSSTDTTRMISCLDSGMTVPSTRYITLGKENSSRNQAEFSFYYAGSSSTDNLLTIGFHSLSIMSIKANGSIGIGKAPPVEASVMDVAWNINTDLAYRMDGTDVITSSKQFVGSGGINTTADISTTARIGCHGPLGAQIFNSSYNNAELRLYCVNLGACVMNQQNNFMYLGTNNETFITMRKSSGGMKCTCIGGDNSDLYPLSISGTTLGNTYSSSGYLNSAGNTGTTPAANGVVGLYCNGRILATEFNASSDVRLKKDIKLLDMDIAMRFVEEAIPKSFLYKDEKIPTYGYIAQDLIKGGFFDLVMLHPNDKLTELTDDDGYISPAGIEMSLQSRSIIPLLHLSIKKAHEEISELKRIISFMHHLYHKDKD